MIQINFFVFIFIAMVFLFMALAIWCLIVDLKEIDARNAQLIKDNFESDSEAIAKKIVDRISGRR